MPDSHPTDLRASDRTPLLLVGLLLLFAVLFMNLTVIPPSGQVLAGDDIEGAFYPWLHTMHDAIRTGRLPLWDPDHYAGSPLFSNPQVGMFYPPAWLAVLLPVNVGVSLYVLLHYWVAGVGMLLFTREMGARWTGALLAAISFSLSGFAAARLWAGHIGVLATYSWTPWILAATAFYTRRWTRGAALLGGLPFGLAVLAGHPTSLVYILVIWLGFGLYLAISSRQWLRVTYGLALAGIAGLVFSAVELIPMLESLPYMVASGAQLPNGTFPWSMPPAHLITMLAPDFTGDPIHGYWGPIYYQEMTYYVGVLPLIGLALALRRPGRLTWLYAGLVLFGSLAALGSNSFLYPLLYRLVPLFKAARAPGRAMFVAAFALCALLADSFTRWEAAQKAPPGRRGFLALALALLGAGGMIAASVQLNSAGLSEQQHALVALLRGLSTGAALSGLLWALAVLGAQGTRWRAALVAALAALVLADLGLYGMRLLYLEPVPPNTFWQDARAMIGQPEERIATFLEGRFANYYQGQAAEAGMISARGYGPLFLKSNMRLAGPELEAWLSSYDVLNVRYVLAADALRPAPTQSQALELVGQHRDTWVYRRPNTLPLVRLVTHYEVVADPDEAAERLLAADFDPAQTVILAAAPPCTPDNGPGQGTARVIEHRPEYWQIETAGESAALLVLSESAYPGWQAAVDGQPAATLLAYSGLRAVCVPAGQHRVEWRFDPLSVKIGGALSLLALILIGIAWFTGEGRALLASRVREA